MTAVLDRRLLLDIHSLEFAYRAPRRQCGLDGSQDGRFRLGPFSFDIYAGDFLAIIGPNGSGKSTLLRLMAGLLRPTRGDVSFAGSDISLLAPRERARRIAVVRQEASLVFPSTVEQFVLLGRYPYAGRFGFEREEDARMARLAMEATHIWSLAHRHMDEISGGERQRAVLARALAQEPELLLLDEPTANLDLSFQVELLRLIRRQADRYDFGVVAVMHEVNLASEFADYMMLLRAGRLSCSGTPEEVLTQRTLEEVYGVPMRIDRNPFSGRPHVTVIASASL